MTHDQLAARIADEYGLFLLALSGCYQALRAPGIEVTPKALKDLRASAQRHAQTMYGIAEREINDYLRPLLKANPDALEAPLAKLKLNTLVAILAMVQENVEQIVKQAQTGRNDLATLLATARGAMGRLAQQMVGTIRYRVTERATGRKRDARALMYSTVSNFAYEADQIYVEAT